MLWPQFPIQWHVILPITHCLQIELLFSRNCPFMAWFWIGITVKASPWQTLYEPAHTQSILGCVSIPFPSHEPFHAPRTSHLNLSTMTLTSYFSSLQLHTAFFFLSIRLIVLRDNELHQLLNGKIIHTNKVSSKTWESFWHNLLESNPMTAD